MKLVIDIPDEVYSYVKREWVDFDIDAPINHVMRGIVEGTKFEQKWISVNDRLPDGEEDSDPVLVAVKYADSDYQSTPRVMGYRSSTNDWFDHVLGWLSDFIDKPFELLAWMPLPQSYEVESEDEE